MGRNPTTREQPLAKRDRSSSLLLAALCAVVGCTAIVDGNLDPSPAGPPIAHGSQSGLEGVAGASSSGGDASAEHVGLGGMSADASAAGAASDAVTGGAGGGAALAEAGAGGREQFEIGGNSSAGAQHAGAGDATGGEPVSAGTGSGGTGLGGTGSGGTGSGGSGGSSAGTSSGGTNGDVITWKGPLPVGDPAKGHLLVIADRCGSCHAENLAGRGFYRNITPDVETGIGSWTDRQIANAIRGGGGPGTQFCSVMPLYSGLKDRQVADMVAYLRSVPAISNEIVSICPGHYPPGGQ